MSSLEENQIVWAKKDEKWGLGVLTEPKDETKNVFYFEPKQDDERYVLWLGDGRIAQIKEEQIKDFTLHFTECFDDANFNGRGRKVVEISVKIAALRTNVPMPDPEDWVAWAHSNISNISSLFITDSFYGKLQERLEEKTCVKSSTEAESLVKNEDNEGNQVIGQEQAHGSTSSGEKHKVRFAEFNDSHQDLTRVELTEEMRKSEDTMRSLLAKIGLKKGRGRPRSQSPATEISKKPKLAIGRPRKDKPAAAETPEAEKRGRGRPPKKSSLTPGTSTKGIQTTPDGSVKRGRGRPPKKSTLSPSLGNSSDKASLTPDGLVKRGRGRPPKKVQKALEEEVQLEEKEEGSGKVEKGEVGDKDKVKHEVEVGSIAENMVKKEVWPETEVQEMVKTEDGPNEDDPEDGPEVQKDKVQEDGPRSKKTVQEDGPDCPRSQSKESVQEVEVKVQVKTEEVGCGGEEKVNA